MTDDELLDGLRHVAYEYVMLERTADALLAMDWATCRLSDDEKFQRNVLLESFAVHARILYEFLWRPQQLKDFHATAYIPDWSEKRPDVLVFDYSVTDAKGKTVEPNVFEVASQRIVHLSRARHQYEPRDEGWPVKIILKAIHEGMNRFYHRLDTSGFSARALAIARESARRMEPRAIGTSHFDSPHTFALSRFIRSWDDIE